jgi:2-phosphosulfolactate phosphatase
MSESARPAVFVHLLPPLIPPGALRGAVAVVVDVLRATTVMVQALAAGCEALVPCAEIDEAKSFASRLSEGTVLLAGERQGLPIAGFDLGNSPGDFTPEVCRGKTLVMTTTNGTRAILACREAETVLVAAFTNLSATVSFLLEQRRPVHVVCAGTVGHVSLEDTLLAGAIAGAVVGAGRLDVGNDSAGIAVASWESVVRTMPGGEGGIDPAALSEALSRGRGGRRVREIGLASDIEAAAQVDALPIVARRGSDGIRIVSG